MDPALRKRLTLAGAVLLSIWALPTVVLGLIFSAGLIFFDMPPPILYITLDPSQIENIDPAVMSGIKDLAIIFNGSSAALGILVMIISLKNLRNGEKWAWLVLLFIVGFTQIISFVGDAKIGNPTIFVNILLTLFYAAGILLSGVAIYKK